MTKSEARQLVAVLFAAYQQANIREKTLEVYETMLADLEFHPTQQAIMRLVATSKWLPTIAEIRAMSVDLKFGPQRSGLEAWGDVVAAIRAVGSYGCPKFEDPCVAECVRIMDWRTLCLSENDTADRARFVELYDNLQTRERRDHVAGRQLPPAQGMVSLERVSPHALLLMKDFGRMPEPKPIRRLEPKERAALAALDQAEQRGQLTPSQQAELERVRKQVGT